MSVTSTPLSVSALAQMVGLREPAGVAGDPHAAYGLALALVRLGAGLLGCIAALLLGAGMLLK